MPYACCLLSGPLKAILNVQDFSRGARQSYLRDSNVDDDVSECSDKEDNYYDKFSFVDSAVAKLMKTSVTASSDNSTSDVSTKGIFISHGKLKTDGVNQGSLKKVGHFSCLF